MVTDDAGLTIIEALGIEYSHVLTTLEAGPIPNSLRHVWALGKSVAILAQTSPFLHIDTDVLLTKPLDLPLVWSRLVAQSLDYPEHYRSEEMTRAISAAGFPAGHTAYNCGVIGGSDIRLLHDYARRTLSLAERFAHPENRSIHGTVASMVVEQYHLGVIAREAGVKVDTVLPMHPTTAQFSETGYIHLQGNAKHEPKWITRVEHSLSTQFPKAYRRFVAGWPAVESGEAFAGIPRTSSSIR
jgi:hypothetical protein